MSALTKILTGAAGLAAVVGVASPAAAQYYPSPNYGYGNQGNVLGTILNGVLGGGGYGNQGYGQGNDRYAASACARAVEGRLSSRGGYNSGYGYGGGYNNGYGYNNNSYGGGRVMGITQIERKSYGLKVRGVASSGANVGYNNGYGGGYGGYNNGYGGYGNNNAYGAADLNFSCRVDRNGRVSDVNLERIRNAYYRGY